MEEQGVQRTPEDRWLFGVCGGFAAHFGVRSWLVRLLWAVSVIPTAGLSAIAYGILARLMPGGSTSGRNGA